MYHWYFTYYLTRSDGYECKADATISSTNDTFPIGDVFKMYRESFDNEVDLTILNVIPISKEDFDYLSKEVMEDV